MFQVTGVNSSLQIIVLNYLLNFSGACEWYFNDSGRIVEFHPFNFQLPRGICLADMCFYGQNINSFLK